MQRPKHNLFGALLGGLRLPAKLSLHGVKLLTHYGPLVLQDRRMQPVLCCMAVTGGFSRLGLSISRNSFRSRNTRYGALSSSQTGFGSEGRRVTDALVVLNCAIYAAQVLTNGSITVWGLKSNAAIRQGQLWRIVTSGFLHGGLLHLAANCYSLMNIGPVVERTSGRLRFSVVYASAVVGGTMGSFFLSPNNALGASGGVFGLMGALGIYLYRHKEQLGGSRVDAMLQSLGQNVLINLAMGMSPGIDNWGHVGGLLGGAVAAFLLGPQWRRGNSNVIEDRPPLKLLASPPRNLY